MRISPMISRWTRRVRPRKAGKGAPVAAAILSLVGLYIVTLAGPARADSADPTVVVKTTVDHVLSIVVNPAYKNSRSERRKKLLGSIEGKFDFPLMAKSALGVHWRELAQSDRDKFVALFTKFVESSYTGTIESYSGEKINYLQSRPEGDQYSQVMTEIIPKNGGDPIKVNYRLELKDGQWMVYDVVIDEISMVANYRTQFNRIINNRGYPALYDDMTRKVQSLESGS